jgi:hypothetical protein
MRARRARDSAARCLAACLYVLLIGGVLLVLPGASEGREPTGHHDASIAATLGTNGCPLAIVGYRSTPAGSARIGPKWFCLARCAGECGTRAWSCLNRLTPSAIALCFAIRCGPKGAKCVRNCF